MTMQAEIEHDRFVMQDPISEVVCVIYAKGDKCGYAFYQGVANISTFASTLTDALPSEITLERSMSQLVADLDIPSMPPIPEARGARLAVILARLLVRDRQQREGVGSVGGIGTPAL